MEHPRQSKSDLILQKGVARNHVSEAAARLIQINLELAVNSLVYQSDLPSCRQAMHNNQDAEICRE